MQNCVKCGETFQGAPEYRPAYDAGSLWGAPACDQGRIMPDRLKYTCRCGYTWTTPCKDAKK